MQTSTTAQSEADKQLAEIKKKQSLEKGFRNGVSWFYWIAGFSFLNTIIYAFGGSWNFHIGLGATQFIDGYVTALATQTGPSGGWLVRGVGFVLDLAIGGIFVVAGVLGRKRYRWAISAGAFLYALDALLFVWFQMWINVGFHAIAWVNLSIGLGCLDALRRMDRADKASGPLSIFPDEHRPSAGLGRLYRSTVIALVLLVACAFIVFLILLFGYIH